MVVSQRGAVVRLLGMACIGVLVGSLAPSARAVTTGTLSFSGRTWTTQFGDPDSTAYPQPQTVTSLFSSTANSGSMTGLHGDSDTVMLTPVSLSAGQRVSFDYSLTNNTSLNRGSFTSYDSTHPTWTDTGVYFTNVTTTTDSPLVTHRVIFQQGNPTLADFQRFSNLAPGVSPDSGDQVNLVDGFHPTTGGGVHVTYDFIDNTHDKITVSNLDGSPISGAGGATSYSFSETIPSLSEIQAFRVGLYDSEQTVTLSNFAIGAIPVPEPTALSLLGFGGLALLRRRRRMM